MRFTIAQVLRLVVYAAVTVACALVFAREPGGSQNWVSFGRDFLLVISLSWAMVSVVILPWASKRFYFTLWMLMAGAIVLQSLLDAALGWGHSLPGIPPATREQIAVEALSVLVILGLGFLLLAYVWKRIARTVASWVGRPSQPGKETEQPR